MTVFAQALNFIVLVFLLQRFLYRPIVGAMRHRQERIARQVEEARQAQAEAGASRDRYDALRARLDADREAEMERARAAAAQWAADQRELARQEVELQQQRWTGALAAEQERFWRDFEGRVAREVYSTAQEVLGELAGVRLDERIRERFLEQLADLSGDDAEQLAGLIAGGGAGGIGPRAEVEVSSAHELDGEYREQVTSSVEALLGGEVELTFVERPELLAGIELRGIGWKIGWSLRGYIDAMNRRISGHVAAVMESAAASAGQEAGGRDGTVSAGFDPDGGAAVDDGASAHGPEGRR